MNNTNKNYLLVDLDGTLIKSDLLFEGLVKLLKKNPLQVFSFILILLFKGKAFVKDWLTENVAFMPDEIPVNTHFFHYLLEEKRAGRKLILVTASNEKWANKFSEYCGIFDSVIASTKDFNCKGKNKLKAIKEKIGEEPFEYAGNDYSDLAVWKEADEITVVSGNKKLLNKAQKIKKIKYVFDQDLKSKWKSLLKAIRLHQWAKNILIVLPLIMAQAIYQPMLWLQVLLAFFAFSFAASGVYLLNDLLDLSSDRIHITKKRRSLAAGDFSIPMALFLVPLFLIAGFLLANFLPLNFLITLLVYFLLTTTYSFYLKQITVLDILTLATLYSLRIFAGGAATEIEVSKWLIAFSMFFFLGLAILKRYIELLKKEANSRQLVAGRGYTASDLPVLLPSGIGSGLIAVLVLALYTNSEQVAGFYDQAEFLWLFCVVILYWLLRIWILANRKEVSEDPVVFAIKDKVSYVLFVICGVILFLAM